MLYKSTLLTVCVYADATDIVQQIGSANNAAVYGLYDYMAHHSDELSFHTGDKMLIVRKGDDEEKDWWWASLHDKEGYIPVNYIGVKKLVIPNNISCF